MAAGFNIANIAIASKDVAQAAQVSRLQASAINGSKDYTEEQIDKVAKDFEAVFLNQFLKDMFEGVEVDPLFGGGYAEEVYRDMLLQSYSKQISEAGGVGVASHVREQLLRLQEVANDG